MKHICVGNITIIGSDNGLSPGRRQVIFWISDGILWIRPLGTNFSEILIAFWLKKMRLNVSSAKWRPICLGLNVLRALRQHYVDNRLHRHVCSTKADKQRVRTMRFVVVTKTRLVLVFPHSQSLESNAWQVYKWRFTSISMALINHTFIIFSLGRPLAISIMVVTLQMNMVLDLSTLWSETIHILTGCDEGYPWCPRI